MLDVIFLNASVIDEKCYRFLWQFPSLLTVSSQLAMFHVYVSAVQFSYGDKLKMPRVDDVLRCVK